MNTPSQHNIAHSQHSQSGLSLVELMISITIGLILLLGITSLIVQQSSTRDELEKSSRQIENGRYSIQRLHDDIQLAGYYGEFYAPMPSIPPALPDPCDTSTGGLAAAVSMPIQGYNAPNTSPITCLDSRNLKPGTDILVVRRAATGVATGVINTMTPPEILLQTTASSYVISTVTGPINTNTPPLPAPFTLVASGVPAPLREYWVHIYFISPCSVMANGTNCQASDDNGNPIPTLKRLDITDADRTVPPTPTPIAEGIENLQLDYGMDTDVPGDGYPDTYTADPASTTNWANVVAVSVNLLARNTICSTGYQDTKTYQLGQFVTVSSVPSTCTNGDYKRHVFSELVRLVNPSGRRALQ